MSDALARIRFSSERQLIALLFERYGLEDVLARYLAQDEALPFYELVISSQVRLTPLIAPRLTGLLAEVAQTLGFDEELQLFVEPNAEINAFALHALSADRPHVVSVTSGLVERMTDEEIRFVLGHELGHLSYRHYRSRLLMVALGADEEGESKVPPLLHRRLETWDRLAEISADRAGHAATGGDLPAIVSAFFKMASGLGPEHLRYDITAFLSQLDDLQRLGRRDLLARFSHPVTPVRVRAAQLFGEAGGIGASDEQLARVDAQVAEVAQLMELEATEPLEVHLRDCLVGAGLLVSHADGNPPDPSQTLGLLLALLPFCADPEATVGAVRSTAEATALLEPAAAWLAENAGEERTTLFEQLAHIAAIDGSLHPDEEAFMVSLAAKLGLPDKTARELLYDALTTYLQEQASTKTPGFAFEALDEG